MTFREWHLIDDKFDIERSKTMMSKMVRKSIEGGRKALRCVGDMNPFLGTRHDATAFFRLGIVIREAI